MPARIVATADNHLSRFHARMTPAKLEERRGRLRAGLQAAVSHALTRRTDLFLLGGDVFDSPSPTNADLLFVATCLHRLQEAGIPVLGVGGNHDTPSGRTVQSGVAPLSPLADLGGLVYFGSPQLEKTLVRVQGEQLCVGGLTPLPGHNPIDPLEALLGPEGGDVQVFLTHGAIEGHGYGGTEPVLRRRTAASLPNLALALAGHVHAFSTERVGGATLVAPGATEWLTHGEIDTQPGFVEMELKEGRITQVKHVSTVPQPRITLDLDLTELQGDIHEVAVEYMEAHSSPETLMRFRVSGTITRDMYASLRLRRMQEVGESMNFHFDLDATRLALQDEFSRDVVRGVKVSQPQEISLVVEELMQAADSPEQRTRWIEARDKLLSHY